jgi:phage head maturation protease
MSFAFRTVTDSWNTDRSLRTLEEVQLFDVSVVSFPAYQSTMAAIRSRQPSEEEVVVPPKVFSKRLAAETEYLELSRKRS